MNYSQTSFFNNLLKNSLPVWVVFSLVFFGCKLENKSQELVDVEVSSNSDFNQDSLNTLKDLRSFFKRKDDVYILEWPQLLATQFKKEYNEELTMDVEVPMFSDTLTAIAGERVRISGYYIPVDETGDESIVILSAFPYAQCFFCGQAGVESIIDILPNKALPKLKTDDKVTFEGRLKLNSEDYDFLVYILEDARLVNTK